MLARKHLDPVLETKREALLAEEQESRENLIQAYKKSILNTKNVHSSFLFTTENGHLILKCICCLVSSVQPNMYNTSWLDLAAKLGYNDAEIKCVNNLQGPVHDPTQQILQYFAATRDGSVGDVLQALLDLGFLPAVHQTQQYIERFLSEVETSKLDASYVQGNSEDEVNNLVKAANFKPFVPIIFDTVPCKTKAITALEKNYISGNEDETLQMSRPQLRAKPQKKKQYCKVVMLSFASDGLAIAKKMSLILRGTKSSKGFPIGVVTLSENEDEVLKNPVKVINMVMSQVDFVIPVLTEGYFNALNHPNPQSRLLDERYIQYIHDIMLSKFIQNHCVNIHVRPIIPKHEINTICQKKEFNINSIFKPYRTDDELEYIAQTILKSRKGKIAT